jgi:hypothetical protein
MNDPEIHIITVIFRNASHLAILNYDVTSMSMGKIADIPQLSQSALIR